MEFCNYGNGVVSLCFGPAVLVSSFLYSYVAPFINFDASFASSSFLWSFVNYGNGVVSLCLGPAVLVSSFLYSYVAQFVKL